MSMTSVLLESYGKLFAERVSETQMILSPSMNNAKNEHYANKLDGCALFSHMLDL